MKQKTSIHAEAGLHRKLVLFATQLADRDFSSADRSRRAIRQSQDGGVLMSPVNVFRTYIVAATDSPLAVAAVLVAGIGREVIRPPFDVLDLLATLVGGAVMIGWLAWL